MRCNILKLGCSRRLTFATNPLFSNGSEKNMFFFHTN